MNFFNKYGPKRRGIALLMTLLVAALLSASVISFIRAAHLEALVAENTCDYIQAQILARAGLKGAMTILAMDDDYQVDSPTDNWAKFQEIASLSSGLFDEGSFTAKIVDLDRKVNLNSVTDGAGNILRARLNQLERLFELMEFDQDLLPPLLDWLDKDERSRANGAESWYYLALDNPYPAADGPLISPDQMLLIKDFDKKVLYGEEDRPGLLEVLTPWSSGSININTADEKVLLSLDEDLTQVEVQEIIERRESEPFTKIDELKIMVGATAFSRIVGSKLISVGSTHFLVLVEAEFRDSKAVLEAVVKRDKSGVILIYQRAG